MSEATHDGVPARVVQGARGFTAGAGDLWGAVTDVERIPRWFLPISGELALGGRYQLEGNAGGTITRCDRPDGFDVTWEFAGQVSWVAVGLEPDGDGARLTLRHIMPKDEAGEAHWAQYGPGATGVGWDLACCGLALHLARGGGRVDRSESDAWLASAAGKDFVRRCARDWSEAHIAAGEAPDTARAMAGETARFYTGG